MLHAIILIVVNNRRDCYWYCQLPNQALACKGLDYVVYIINVVMIYRSYTDNKQR